MANKSGWIAVGFGAAVGSTRVLATVVLMGANKDVAKTTLLPVVGRIF